MKVTRFLVMVASVLAAGSTARAELVWRVWEGNRFPEQELWQRYTRGGGAERTLADGLMTLDGMASGAIVDEYRWDTPFTLAPGQYLRGEWRFRIEDAAGPIGDPGFIVDAGVHGLVILTYTEDSISSLFEGWIANFAPGVFHKYTLTSWDLSTYQLRVDGQVVHTGGFGGSSDQPGVCWGDLVEGGASLSEWDWVRFGVVSGAVPVWRAQFDRGPGALQLGSVPEPGTGLVLGSTGLVVMVFGIPRRYRR